MSKYSFVLLLMLAASAGCHTLDRQPPPNVTAAPPYWQSQSQRQLAESQLNEMRTFHEKESAKLSEDVHVFRNHEMARLENAGKELEKDKLWQEDYEKTVERRKKWTSWFKSQPQENTKETPSMSMSNTSKDVR